MSKLNKNAWIQFLDSFLVEQSQKTPKKKAWYYTHKVELGAEQGRGSRIGKKKKPAIT